MLLIADSGSTKTDWRIVHDSGEIEQVRTVGLNPYFVGSMDVTKVIGESFRSIEPDEVWFYGAGCSSAEQCSTIIDGMKGVWPKAEIHVDHDMLGAARALCGSAPGIAAILGTGSNSCVYDGTAITEQIPSLGYILGDEGSGAYLGKRLLADYHNREMPDAIAKRFESKFDVSIEVVLENVMKKEFPNRYLASFAKYVTQLKPEQYAVDLIADSFRRFLELRVTKYSGYDEMPLHVTGSVAYYNSDILGSVCSEMGVQLGNVVEAPVARMALYHQGEL